jgi:predicted nucleotidyltransferase
MNKRGTSQSILSLLRAIKPELEAQFGVESVALFGSYARGSQRHDSDIDILVSFKQPPSLLGFIELENALSESLGAKVDLVMEEALKPRIGEHIREDMVSV